MASKLVKSILGVFGGITSSLFGKYALIFIISLMPILELRGGLIAASLLDIEPLWAFIVCMVANILIIPFVLFLIEAVLEFLMRFKKLGQLLEKEKLDREIWLFGNNVIRGRTVARKWSMDGMFFGCATRIR